MFGQYCEVVLLLLLPFNELLYKYIVNVLYDNKNSKQSLLLVSFRYPDMIFLHLSQGTCVGSDGSEDNCVYAFARQSLGNLAQAVIGSTQDPFERLFNS